MPGQLLVAYHASCFVAALWMVSSANSPLELVVWFITVYSNRYYV